MESRRRKGRGRGRLSRVDFFRGVNVGMRLCVSIDGEVKFGCIESAEWERRGDGNGEGEGEVEGEGEWEGGDGREAEDGE